MENENGENPDITGNRMSRLTYYKMEETTVVKDESSSSEEESWVLSESTSIDFSTTEEEGTDESDSDDTDFKDCESIFVDSSTRLSSATSFHVANKSAVVTETALADPETVLSILEPLRATSVEQKRLWKTVKSTQGMISEPTESELAENTWGFGESFADYMTRLYTIADPALSQFNTGFAADGSDEEVLTSESEDNFWAYEQECSSGWEALSRFRDPWAETRYPTPQLLSRQDLTDEDWESPELSIEKIACSISNFTIPPGCSQYACTKLQLENVGLQSVKILSGYRFLQYVDLASNKIEDLSPLWEIPHLVVLDVSHNMVTDKGFGRASGPHFLTYLNVSHNRLTKVPDLRACWALKHLNLSHNIIRRIEVVEHLCYLQYLNISFNKLEVADNLRVQSLCELDLSHNKISEWDQTQNHSLKKLDTLNLSNNNLITLRSLKEIGTLQSLNISYNHIYHLSEFGYLECFPSLRVLALLGNPLDSSITDSRKLLIYKLTRLEVVNGVPVLENERGKAIMQYSLKEFHETMCRDATLFFKQHCFTPFFQSERPKAVLHPAVVVFVGLIGSHRAKIMFECERMDPRKIRVSEFYSTRPKHRHPPNWPIAAAQALQNYVHDKTFYKLQGSGKFVVTYNDLGYRFGIPCSELEHTGQVLLVMTNYSAALSLVSKGFNPTLLLVLPASDKDFEEKVVDWLNTSHIYTSDAHTRLVGGKIFREKKKPRRKVGHNSWHSKLHKTKTRESSKHSSSTSSQMSSQKSSKSTLKSHKITSTMRIQTVSRATQRKLGEAAEKDRFILNLKKMREHYMNQHIEKPGLFRLFIPSDDVDYAVKKAKEIVEEAWERLAAWKEKSAQTIPFSEDPLFEEMVMPIARQYADEILAGRGPQEML